MTPGDVGLTIAEAARRIRSGELSPVELTSAALERIDVLDKTARAFITVFESEALIEARTAERRRMSGSLIGPLDGIPVAVKDLFDVAGAVTTAGSLAFRDRRAATDAAVVRRLRAAGAVIIGKTNLHECAYGVTNVNPHFGATRNPWDPSRISGGSSGGSAAAVALSMALGALGTDTGGSIRIPAALCGVVGLKPTYGRVSLAGAFPLAWTLDHAGPLARSAEDVSLLFAAIAGSDPEDVRTASLPAEDYRSVLEGGLEGASIGIPSDALDGLAPEVAALTRAALKVFEDLGASFVEVRLPGPERHRPLFQSLAGPEVLAVHEAHLEQAPELYSDEIRRRIEAGRKVGAVDYFRALRERETIEREAAAAFAAADLIALPTTPIPASLIGEPEVQIGDRAEPVPRLLTRNTRLFNITHLPALSIPCGFTPSGLPVGLQLAGRPFGEARLLRAAHAYERAAGWLERRPPI